MFHETSTFHARAAGRLRRLLVLLSLCAAQTLAQEPGKAPPTVEQDEEVVTVKSQLVNIDVVVKDRKGKYVTDLKAEDFAVVENGVPQKVLFFDPPLTGDEGVATTQTSTAAREGTRPRARLSRNIISLVLDGQTTDFANMKQAIAGAVKYIRERVSETDRVAVFTVSSGGLQLLQTFTGDKERLVAAVERAYTASNSSKGFEQHDIAENISKLSGTAAGTPAGEGAASPSGQGQMVSGPAMAEAMMANRVLKQYQLLRSTLSAQQARPILAALAALCEGQRSVPGKKTLILFSQGFVSPAVLDWQVQSTIDIANRANVSIYVIDSAGLRAGAPASGALVPAAPLAGVSGIVSQEERIRAVGGENVFDRARFEGINREFDILYRISEDSGGKFIKNTNDIAKGLGRVDEEIRSRYTLGYQSTDANFDGSFRKIKLEVLRPDVEVITRPGYYAIAPGEVVPLSPDDKKLLAGFAAAEANPALPLSVELIPFRSGQGLYTVPVSIELPPAAVKFERKGDKQRMHLDFLGVVKEGAGGKILSRLGGSFDVSLTDEQYRAVTANNIFYRQDMALAPGDYTIELVVRDRLSGKVAARKEKLSVPEPGTEFSASRVTLSRYVEPVRGAGAAAAPEDVFREGGVQVRPSPSREFTAADNLIIFFKLYNASADAATAKPSVRVTVILSKDGKAVAKPLSYDLTEASGGAVPHLTFAKFVPLAGLAPGRYEATVESRDMVTLKLVKQKASFSIK